MLAVLMEQGTFLETFFTGSPYIGPFVILLLCGVGLPLPEEVTLIGAGLLLHGGHVEFWRIVLVCSAAILIGDSIPFVLGRKYGKSALKIRWVARILHAERMARLERRFEAHGNWATFACRFVAGIRIPGYFVAGTMGMKYRRFLLLNGLGVLISVPISIYLGKLFGAEVERLQERMDNLHLILAFLVAALVIIMVVTARSRARARAALRRQQEAESAAEEAGDAAPPPLSTPPDVPLDLGDRPDDPA
jgi:membrane protein DedA with SNARE-associated domain